MSVSVRELIGIPFVDGGRTMAGLDCWGLAMMAMRSFGRDLPDFDVSCFDTRAIQGIYDQERSVGNRWTEVFDPAPGDVAAMSIDPSFPGMVQHVGVYVGDGRVLHTMKRRHSHIIRRDDPYWSRKIVGWYRWSD